MVHPINPGHRDTGVDLSNPQVQKKIKKDISRIANGLVQAGIEQGINQAIADIKKISRSCNLDLFKNDGAIRDFFKNPHSNLKKELQDKFDEAVKKKEPAASLKRMGSDTSLQKFFKAVSEFLAKMSAVYEGLTETGIRSLIREWVLNHPLKASQGGIPLSDPLAQSADDFLYKLERVGLNPTLRKEAKVLLTQMANDMVNRSLDLVRGKLSSPHHKGEQARLEKDLQRWDRELVKANAKHDFQTIHRIWDEVDEEARTHGYMFGAKVMTKRPR